MILKRIRGITELSGIQQAMVAVMILAAVAFILFAGFCFDYVLWTTFGKDIPFWADILCGLVLSQFTIPGTLVCYILVSCGITAPFFV